MSGADAVGLIVGFGIWIAIVALAGWAIGNFISRRNGRR